MKKLTNILSVAFIAVALSACSSTPSATYNSSQIKADINTAYNSMYKDTQQNFDLSQAYFKIINKSKVRLMYIDNKHKDTVIAQVWKKDNDNWQLKKTIKHSLHNLDENLSNSQHSIDRRATQIAESYDRTTASRYSN